MVLSIPDWGVTPFAAESGRDRGKIAAEIDRFNQINREETARAGARYVDVTPVSRKAAADRSLIAGDGLHPSGAMYAEWARLALPAAKAALGKRAVPGTGLGVHGGRGRAKGPKRTQTKPERARVAGSPRSMIAPRRPLRPMGPRAAPHGAPTHSTARHP